MFISGWLLLGLLWGCAPIESLDKRYPPISIELPDDQVRWVRVRLVGCEGNQPRTETLLRERPVTVPIGDEIFRLPALQGDVELWVEAYNDFTTRGLNGQPQPRGTILWHVRTRLTRQDPFAAYPSIRRQAVPKALTFQPGQGIDYPPCQAAPSPPKPKEPPQIPSRWAGTSPSTSSPWFPGTNNDAPWPPPPGQLPQSNQFNRLTPTQDRLSLSQHATHMQSNGRFLVLLLQEPARLLLVDTLQLQPLQPALKRLRRFDLPVSCLPRDLALYGNQAAVLCLTRPTQGQPVQLPTQAFVHWLDFSQAREQGAWRALSPPQGYPLQGCQTPTSLTFAGNRIAVTCFTSGDVHLYGPPSEGFALFGRFPCEEGPIDIHYEGQAFYVANAASGSLTTFQPKTDEQGRILPDTNDAPTHEALHIEPLQLAVNAQYIATISTRAEQQLSFRVRESSETFSIRLGDGVRPRQIRLLGHVALITLLDRPHILVIDLKRREITQTLPLVGEVGSPSTPQPTPSTPLYQDAALPKAFLQISPPIALNGTELFASTPTIGLQRLTFTRYATANDKGFQQFRLGDIRHVPMVGGPGSNTPYIWMFDQEAQQVIGFDLQERKVAERFQGVPSPDLVRETNGMLIYVTHNLQGSAVSLRSVRPGDVTPQRISGSRQLPLRLDEKICDIQTDGAFVFFLHCDNGSLSWWKITPENPADNKPNPPMILDLINHITLRTNRGRFQPSQLVVFQHHNERYFLTTDGFQTLALFPWPKDASSYQSPIPIKPRHTLRIAEAQSAPRQLLLFPKNTAESPSVFALLTEGNSLSAQGSQLYLFNTTALFGAPYKPQETSPSPGGLRWNNSFRSLAPQGLPPLPKVVSASASINETSALNRIAYDTSQRRETLPLPLTLRVFSGRMNSYGISELLITDPRQNQLLLLDPSTQEIRQRVNVDSLPSRVVTINEDAIVTSPGSKSVLVVPLLPQRYR